MGGDHRDEGLSGQADQSHQAFHDESAASQVSALFEQRDEEKQDADLGKKDDDATDAGDHAVHQQAVEVIGGHQAGHDGDRGRRDSGFRRPADSGGPVGQPEYGHRK